MILNLKKNKEIRVGIEIVEVKQGHVLQDTPVYGTRRNNVRFNHGVHDRPLARGSARPPAHTKTLLCAKCQP